MDILRSVKAIESAFVSDNAPVTDSKKKAPHVVQIVDKNAASILSARRGIQSRVDVRIVYCQSTIWLMFYFYSKA